MVVQSSNMLPGVLHQATTVRIRASTARIRLLHTTVAHENYLQNSGIARRSTYYILLKHMKTVFYFQTVTGRKCSFTPSDLRPFQNQILCWGLSGIRYPVSGVRYPVSHCQLFISFKSYELQYGALVAGRSKTSHISCNFCMSSGIMSCKQLWHEPRLSQKICELYHF